MVEDENGNIVRETMKDNDVLMQYRVMRETLVYLSHLDHDDTEQIMLEKLRLQVGAFPLAYLFCFFLLDSRSFRMHGNAEIFAPVAG